MRPTYLKYKSVRVVNPQGPWHTIPLYPCQSATIKLRKPMLFLRDVCEKAEFKVTLHSEFLIIEESSHDKVTGDQVLKINQRYDLADWCEWGEVSLGSLNIKLINNSGSNKDWEVDVYFKVKISDKNDCVTVINPYNQCVRIEPHQMLEVVCFERSWSDYSYSGDSFNVRDDKWSYKEKFSNEGLKLVEKKYKTSEDKDDDSIFVLKNRYQFKINPKLGSLAKKTVKSELAIRVDPEVEHHWWFSCSEQTLKQSQRLKSNDYLIGSLDFEGKANGREEILSSCRSVTAMLSIKGKKKMNPLYANPNSVEYKHEMTKRHEVKKILTNPLSTEQVHFNEDKEYIILELIQPDCFWSDLPENTEWKVEMEPRKGGNEFNLMVLDKAKIWGKNLQRFKIENRYKPKNGVETRFLGAINITCPERIDHHDGKKRLSFWLTPKKTVVPMSNFASTPGFIPGPINQEISKRSNVVPFYSNNKKKELEYRGPRVSILQIDELKGNLADSTNTIKFNDVKLPYSETDFYRKKKQEPSTTYTSTSTLLDRAAGNAKQEKEGKTNSERNNQTIGGKRSITYNADNDRIVIDPEHLSRLTINEDQSLIIRMSLPDRVFMGKCEEEHWGLVYNGDIKLNYFKTINVKDTLYQEVKITAASSLPSVGLHHIGCVKLSCSEATIAIFVFAEKSEVKPMVVENVRVPVKIYDGANKRSYICEWSHNDAICIDPENSFLLRNPTIASEWESGHWTATIDQHKLDKRIFDHKDIKDLLGDIDVNSPWFNATCLNQIGNTFSFQSLVLNQIHTKAILKVAAELMNVDYLPIAKINFKNTKHPNNSALTTAIGSIETNYTLTKSLDICVSLVPYKTKDLNLIDPPHEEEVSLKNYETVTVRLKPVMCEQGLGGLIEAPWYLKAWPDFLKSEESKMDEESQVFKFIVQRTFPHSKIDKISLIAGNCEKDLIVNYEK